MLCLPVPAAENSVRLFFNFESQIFCLRVRGGEAEALVIHGGRVTRRSQGLASPQFTDALLALEKRPAKGPVKVTVTREDLIRPNFFCLFHPRFTSMGQANQGTDEIATLLSTARELAFAMPEAERSGLYILAFPASVSGLNEDIVAAATVPQASPLHAALSSTGFPRRLTGLEEMESLPKHSAFTVTTSDGGKFLVSYAEAAPFSLRTWLNPPQNHDK